MGKFKIKAPIGGHQQKVWMPGEIASSEKDFRVPVEQLIGDGFIEAIEDSEAAPIEAANEANEKQFGIPTGDEKKEEVKTDDVKTDEKKDEPTETEDDVTMKEIKAQLDYEGIKYPSNATKLELFEIYKKK